MYEKNRMIHKQDEMLKTYEKWMNKIQEKRSLASYFATNHYDTIAIYGMGRIGKQLYRELLTSDIQVEYGIDRSVTYYDRIPCYSPCDRLPDVDLIIVTVPDEANDIIEDLKKKVSCPIQTINDILFMV